jgi:hypothetical protein
MDDDPKIQILVHDIFGDYYSTQSGGTFGYFYSGDEYTSANSNRMEIFYVDAHFADRAPDAIYSTLVHEFQHMIHFNCKNGNSSTWYNEMLSMLAEDVIDPFIGIDANANTDGHPIEGRIPLFLGYYNMVSPTVWLDDNYVYYSYANSYAFGAYLVRNFGGAKLIQELMSNSAVDEASVTAALASAANTLHPEVNTFDKALRRYGEALVFSQPAAARPSGVLSFNNTVTTDNIGDNSYEFTGFNIWDIGQVMMNNGAIYPSLDSGPRVFDTEQQLLMNSRTMLLQSKTAWQNIISGSLSITVQKPASSAIEVYVMVR